MFAIVFQQAVPRIGFGWTTRVIAFIILISLIPPILTMRKRVPRSPKRALVDKAALREVPFVIALCAMLLLFVGLVSRRKSYNVQMSQRLMSVFTLVHTILLRRDLLHRH